MGWEGKCEYVYKCERCGDEQFDVATQDGSGKIAKLHERWEATPCGCGGRYRLFESSWQGWDGDGTFHTDIAKYFNATSTQYHEQLTASLEHPSLDVRTRAAAELKRFFPRGKPR